MESWLELLPGEYDPSKSITVLARALLQTTPDHY